MFLFNALMAHMALYSLLNVLLSFPPLYLSAVVLLNSKETQAELGWTSYPPNGVSLLTCIFLIVCMFVYLLVHSLGLAAQLLAQQLPQTFSSLPFSLFMLFIFFPPSYLSFPLFLTPCLRFSPGPELVIIINRWSHSGLGYCSVQTCHTDMLPRINGPPPPPYWSIWFVKNLTPSYDSKTNAWALFKESATVPHLFIM